MPPSRSSWESADDLLARLPTLGIPHFQRGLVWGTDGVALLLESLFWSTPCGSVILWQPLDAASNGIPLGEEPRLRHLIVDGQQRIRSLWSVFGTASSREVDDAQSESTSIARAEALVPRVWCVDLTHVPGLEQHFGAPSRFSLFRIAADPRHPHARVRKALLPLAWLRSAECAAVETHVRTHAGAAAAEAVRKTGLEERLREMTREPLFAVRILEETATRDRLPEIVAVYNRINSAGKRVEAEERAYAALVSYAPGARDWLAGLFEEIHGGTGGAAGAAQRDGLLQRRKESAFGFKLFLRAFVQVAAYHTRYSIGSSGFSFDLLESDGFHRTLASPENAQKVAVMLDRTRQILVFIRRVLRDDLHCDDLRMLPDTSSLWPVIQLLIRFPRLIDDEPASAGRRAVSGLILRLYLRAADGRELMRLVGAVNRAHTAKECLQALARAIPPSALAARLVAGLRQALSLQDRHVLLLYWLLRRSPIGLRDFSYENLARLGRPTERSPEALIDAEAQVEKQHLVPYASLAKLYGIEGRVRVVTHVANAIGNLTFISGWLNGFDEGLGGDPVDLGLEPTENLHAHLLGTHDGLDLRALHAAASNATNAEAYERFCEARRGVIEGAFARWLEETENWSRVLDGAERIDPSELLFLITDAERIRCMDYPESLTDALLRLLDAGRLRRTSRTKETGWHEVFQLRSVSSSRTAIARIDLARGRLGVEAVGAGLDGPLAAAIGIQPRSTAQAVASIDVQDGVQVDSVARALRAVIPADT